MKVAVAIKENGEVSGHAGKARHWLMFDLAADDLVKALAEPARLELTTTQLFHYFEEGAPHPLDGAENVVAGSAGDGFVRRMRQRGADVLLTGETDPRRALECIAKGETLPDPRFDITTSLCKLRDLFSRH